METHRNIPVFGVVVLVVAVVVGLLAGLDPPRARADTPDIQGPTVATPPRSLDAEVERQATRGQRLLDRGETQEAIAAFRRAYELRADARFLYDIAECYRQLGLVEQALHFYRRYLSVAPDAADRDEVEADIVALEKRLPPRPARAPAAAELVEPSLVNDFVILPLEEPPPEERPLWRRWWTWTALGAVIAGSAALAIALSRDGSAPPPTALGDKTFY